jgi:periplasmic protein TonB
MTADTANPGRSPPGRVCLGSDSNCTLALTFGLALAAHLLVILGVRIEAPVPGPRKVSTVEVVVVRQPQPSQTLPDKVAVAAQVTQGGSGEGRRDATTLQQEIQGLPQSAPTGLSALDLDLHEPETTPDQVTEPAPEHREEPLSESMPDPMPPEPPPAPEQAQAETDILAAESQASLTLSPAKPKGAAPPVTAAQILASRNQELAHLASRDEDKTSVFSSRPRRKAISSSTREYKYATYLEGWRRKVEQVGNLNYPDEARRKHLYGNLILRVAVRADGSVEQIQVLRSSGFPVLDQAATHIVELSAPFAPFPPDIKADTDVLDITRTWQFQRNNQIGWGN